MSSTSATATVRSRYAEQAASDLAENRRRQQELTRQLEVLTQEETLLVNIMSLAEHTAAAPDPAHVPHQAQGEPALLSAAPAPAAPAAQPAAEGAVDEPPARAEDGDGGRKKAERKGGRQVLLRDLLWELLSAHDSPRLAAELREELLRAHPDRSPTPQVVRNTLEALVAKGRIQRHKQNRSVMYTVVEPDGAA